MSLGQFARRKQWYNNAMTPAAVHEDLQNLRQELQRGFPGTNTNDSALVGYVGEVISSAVGRTNFPATGVYGDLTSITLTPGDWIVGANVDVNLPASITEWYVGISTTTGDSSAGLTIGDNYLSPRRTFGVNDRDSATIVNYHVQLSASTVHYLKYAATYASTAPQASGRITAIRIR